MPTALITGASSGIGAAFARLLVADGYHVVLVARRAHKLEELASELNAVRADCATVLPADITNEGAAKALAENLAGRGLLIDCLINNAGLGKHGAFVEQGEVADRQMIDLNMTALTAMMRAFLPGMVERKSGSVLNVASTAAFQSIPYMAVYAATKAYVLSLSEAVADEVAPYGVKVSCLCPGPTETEFTAVAEFKSDVVDRAPNMMSAETVAREGLAALKNGRPMHIPGVLNALTSFSPRFLPRSMMTKLSGMIFKPTVVTK